MGKLKKESGITLIALVVTIIVLLILAGVSISMLTGENGILNKAKEAKEETDVATRKERADLDKMSELIDETMSGEQTVEQVTDEHPGQLEDDGDEKVINSIEDLVFFAYDVTNGNKYSGQTVKLGLNLDFNSTKSYVEPYRIDYGQYGYNGELKTLLTSGEGFKPIGTNTNETGYESKSFSGTFDGNGKIIKNLYINSKVENNEKDLVIGLFGYNYGTIKKLGIENCNNNGNLITSGVNTCMVGGIAGRNCKGIEECFASGNIESVCSTKSRCGGICATSDASTNIKNCYNLATVNCTCGNQANVVGGIAGNTQGNIDNCFNDGKIRANCDSEEAECMIGGIVGIKSLSDKDGIKNCYNLNDIILDFRSSKQIDCGGICGDLACGFLNNCYNKGKISELSLKYTTAYIGLITGMVSGGDDHNTANNCSSLSFHSYKACGGSKDETNLDNLILVDNEANMPNILNILGEKFKNGINSYPILSWQKE